MKSRDRWVNSNTSVYNLGYHIIWCPKYRRKVLINEIENKLKDIIITKCNELDCYVHELNIMPDHVHLFVKTKPTIAPHFLIQQIKGISSRILRNEFKELKRKMPSMWTRSYFIESIEHISQETIENK